MRVEHKSCECIINLILIVVFDHSKQIKSTKDWISQINIVIKVQVWFVSTAKRIGSSDD